MWIAGIAAAAPASTLVQPEDAVESVGDPSETAHSTHITRSPEEMAVFVLHVHEGV